MTDVRITVRGEYTAYRQPERATVRLVVALEGPKLGPVHAAVAASLEQVVGGISRRHDPESGPVTWYANEQIRTWARRPWNQDGKQLPLVHHARASVQAKFSDFDALSAWLGEVVEVPGVAVEGIEWALTEAHRKKLVREVRAEAVRNARDKAQEYAEALALGPVRVIEIADAGMLGEGLAPTGPVAAMAYSRAGGAGGGGEVRFVPEDVSVEATVDARFLLSG